MNTFLTILFQRYITVTHHQLEIEEAKQIQLTFSLDENVTSLLSIKGNNRVYIQEVLAGATKPFTSYHTR